MEKKVVTYITIINSYIYTYVYKKVTNVTKIYISSRVCIVGWDFMEVEVTLVTFHSEIE